MKTKLYASFMAAMVIFAVINLPVASFASHAWGNYHWARTSNPFTLKITNSHTNDWVDNFNGAVADWHGSSVLNMTPLSGATTSNTRKRCPMISGQVRSCNAAYGFNGWLGLASINVTGGVHITQGTSKMNDSYFSSPSYNETARSHVVCQEIGHTFGLGHQSESGADLNTCMDYDSNLSNAHPNSHDYAQLETIYNSHLDSTTTVGFAAFGADSGVDINDDPRSWGRLVHQSANGRSSVYERDNWNGSKTITHVFWTQEFADRCHGCDHRFDH